jgi:hypothetical protein
MKRGRVLLFRKVGLTAAVILGGCIAPDGGYVETDVGVYGAPVVESPGWYGGPGYGGDTVIIQPGFDHRNGEDDRRGGDEHRGGGAGPAGNPAPRNDDRRVPGIPTARRPEARSAPRGAPASSGDDRDKKRH